MKSILLLLPFSLMALDQELTLTMESARNDDSKIKGVESTLEYAISQELSHFSLNATIEAGHSKIKGSDSESDLNLLSVSP